MTRLAVIILNWNGAEMMRRFLPGVVHMTPEAEIWVADNASTDDSLEMLREHFPTVRTLALDRNYGFAEGYNRAIAQIEAEVVVLLNSDVQVTEGWAATLLRFMDEHADVAAVQPKLRSHAQPSRFEYAGAAGGYLDHLGYPFCRGRIFGTVEEDLGQHDTVADVHWTTGAAMMVRRDIYLQEGGLDSSFFAHMEEIDLCWRMRNHGHRLCCVPQSVVYHVGGGTLPQGNPRKTYLNFRNNLLMIHKNHPDAARVLKWRWWLDALASLQYLMKGEVGSFSAVWKARGEFAKMKGGCTTAPGNAPLFEKSILWQYYVKNRHTWQNFT